MNIVFIVSSLRRPKFNFRSFYDFKNEIIGSGDDNALINETIKPE
jgi:hypothetical protein